MAATRSSFFFRLGLVAMLAAGMAQTANPMQKQTYTFKTVGDLKIQVDVYRADDSKARPVLVWLHGGSLVMGNRKSVPPEPARPRPRRGVRGRLSRLPPRAGS